MTVFQTTNSVGSGIRITIPDYQDLILAPNVVVASSDDTAIKALTSTSILLSAGSVVANTSDTPNTWAIDVNRPNEANSRITIADGATVSSSIGGIITAGGSVEVTNHGDITSRFGAIEMFDPANTFVNTGNITSDNIAVRVWDQGDITNFGTIIGGSYGAVTRNGGGRIENNGAISADTAVYLGGDNDAFIDNGELINTGTINGGSRGVQVVNDPSKIVNTGTITASQQFGVAIEIANFLTGSGFIYELDNSGTISALGSAYEGSDAIDVINNQGLMTGQIFLGGNVDIYDGRGGQHVGTLFGGNGNDQLRGGDETDIFWGGAGFDLLVGYGGDDELRGNNDDDVLRGGDGADALFGGEGRDTLFGGTGDDQINGEDGNDVGHGNTGNDEMFGGAGQDNLRGGHGDDTIDGGTENDNLYGQSGADTLNGADGNDKLFGGADDDTLIGGSQRDLLRGGAGNDTLIGDAGADSLHGGTGDDVLTGGTKADTFFFRRAAGEDVITDFENGVDKIDLTAFGLQPSDYASTVATALSNAGSGTTFLDLTLMGGNGSVLIEGVSFANVDASDFIL